jgi:hypothetical protein
MQHIYINEEEDVINLKSKSSHSQNIWNYDIDHDIANTHLLIPITNALNIEKYDLNFFFSFNHVIH